MSLPIHLLASAHVSARGMDCRQAAASVLAGDTACACKTVLGCDYPYFSLPLTEVDWKSRARCAIAACRQQLVPALEAADWRQTPLFVASSSFQIGDFEQRCRIRGRLPAIVPAAALSQEFADWLGMERSATLSFSTACTSAFSAIATALPLLQSGELKRALILACELDNSLTLAGFQGLGLLSSTAALPFDVRRDGLVLGESVAAILLSNEPLAGSWRLASCHLGLDGNSPTGLSPDGLPLAEVIVSALRTANVPTRSIDCIKLHAAGAIATDLAEARALRRVWGSELPTLLSLKPCFGHTLGASGLCELTALLACLQTGQIPATPGFAMADPEIGMQPGTAVLKTPVRHLLLNGIGFGGNLAAMVLSRDEA